MLLPHYFGNVNSDVIIAKTSKMVIYEREFEIKVPQY